VGGAFPAPFPGLFRGKVADSECPVLTACIVHCKTLTRDSERRRGARQTTHDRRSRRPLVGRREVVMHNVRAFLRSASTLRTAIAASASTLPAAYYAWFFVSAFSATVLAKGREPRAGV